MLLIPQRLCEEDNMTLNLKKLSVDDLLTLRDRINAVLESRVVRERQELEARLRRLQRYETVSSEPSKNKSISAPTKQQEEKIRNARRR